MLKQSPIPMPPCHHTSPKSTSKEAHDEETSCTHMEVDNSEIESGPKAGDVSLESINSEISEDPPSIAISDSFDEDSDERSQSEDITDLSEKDLSKSEGGEGSFLDPNNLKCDSNKTDVILNNSGCTKQPSLSTSKGISKKRITPKQRQNRLTVEMKRQERRKEKEEITRKKKEERERIKQELLKKKEEIQREKEKRNEERQKQKMEKEEQKRKEKEEREQKRKEKEEKDEQKRKQRDLEMLKKQQENEEKRKLQEKKDKIAAAFKNFFVKKQDKKPSVQEAQKLAFKPFELKSGMTLPPTRRVITPVDIKNIDFHLQHQAESSLYLNELKAGKPICKSSKTQLKEEAIDDDNDVVIVETDLGETICEDRPKQQKFHVKFLMFHDNRRPPYYGTWRKKSNYVTGRKPFGEDKSILNYEQDSDEEWEEEEQGESLEHSEDEADKENNEDKDDYEVDNDFFVPHGHLSDDEMDEDGNATLSPEHQKKKLKLLNDEFEKDRKGRPIKLKPRFIGCVWYNKNGDNVEPAIDRQLKPYAVICKGPVKLNITSYDYIPLFIQRIHGNVNGKRCIVDKFLAEMASKGVRVNVSKNHLIKLFKEFAVRKKVKDKITKKPKLCWWVAKDVLKNYGIASKNQIRT